ncbi:GH-E family nuclease [Roseovarius sp.]|uniref:GH-E family nuclease n=1 Tax=Roseovarius sp. TaxID=1486281 RepID=UPI0034514D94
MGAAVWARGFRAIPHAPLNQRKQVRKEVEARTPQTPDGRFIDANTGDPIEGNHDLGHKYGHEFRREKAKAEAEAEGLSQPEFNERMNNPDLYQIEDPINNRGHRFEKPGND